MTPRYRVVAVLAVFASRKPAERFKADNTDLYTKCRIERIGGPVEDGRKRIKGRYA